MRARIVWLSGLSAAFLCGCQDQKPVVAQQTPSLPLPPTAPPLPKVLPPGLRQMPPMPHRRHVSPCAAPLGAGPYAHAPKPLHSPTVPVPQRALAEHVAGCAGVSFRIAPDGTPRDVAVVVEYPPGYGFGDTARKVVQSTAWPPMQDKSLHYVNIRINTIK